MVLAVKSACMTGMVGRMRDEMGILQSKASRQGREPFSMS